VIGLFLKIKTAGFLLAAVLVFWEIRWLIRFISSFSWMFRDNAIDEELYFLHSMMNFVRLVHIWRGVFFISITVFVVYAMLFNKSVKEYFIHR